jgi:hypothetical protein
MTGGQPGPPHTQPGAYATDSMRDYLGAGND